MLFVTWNVTSRPLTVISRLLCPTLLSTSPACDEAVSSTTVPCAMSSQLLPLRLMKGLMVTLAVAVLQTAIRSSVGANTIPNDYFAVEDFTCADAARLLPPRGEPPLILQVVNEHYLKMQENFMLIMRQNSPQRMDSICLICLDDNSADTMGALFGIPCVRLDGVTSLRDLWVTRAKILVCLLQEGHDVLLSDNDALWLSDPIPDLRAIEGDILVQRGIVPAKYRDPVYGSTMCMGFGLFRAGGERMSKFLQVMADAVNQSGDDQVGLNKAASLLGLKWDYNTSRSDMRNTESTRVGLGVLTDLPGNFIVALLPHNRYTRNCRVSPVSSETIVAHCFPRHGREQALSLIHI